MAEIKLFIACSLDGYIARPNGSIDWLNSIPNPDNSDFGYGEFYSGVDIVVMGRSTYQEILGFDVEWPYADRTCYVVTSRQDFDTPTPNTRLVTEVTPAFIDLLRGESEKNIWIVGGGKLVAGFLLENAVDEMQISLISRIIGEGIPLFPSPLNDTKWRLTGSQIYNEAAITLVYRRSE